MPGKDGLELCQGLKAKGVEIPTLFFFDPLRAGELIEARKMGNRAFIAKNSPSGSMPALAPLIKKLAYFG